MSKMLVASLAVLALAAPTANVTGTWNMGLHDGHMAPVALVLKQDGKAITGTIALPMPHGGERIDVALEGALEGTALTLKGTVESAHETMTIEISGTLLDDGTMEGTASMVGEQGHTAHWTAERVMERKY
jgi:hypothetical protein